MAHESQPPYPSLPAHPQATTALVLGILGLALCALAAPFAWAIGKKAVDEIDRYPASYSGRSVANAGRILGIVGTVIMGLAVVIFVGALVAVGIAAWIGNGVD